MTAAGAVTDRRAAPQTGVGSRGVRLRFALLVIAILCTFCAPLFVDGIDRSAPKPVAGRVDYAKYGRLTAPVELRGQWRLVWHSGAPGPPAGTERLQLVPGRWSEKLASGGALPDQGAASYHLTVEGLQPGRYSLYVPTIYAASRVIVNGRMLSEEGVPGPSAATTQATVRSHDVVFDVPGSTLDVQIDLSAFHQRDNGMEGPPVLGPTKAMNRYIALHWLRGLLLLLSLIHI